jgi:hypothetical protein
VTFTLKVRAGTGSTAPSYKMKVAKSEDGTPSEWIDVVNALEEVWKQNAMNLAHDREASIKTISREDALTAFESSIDNSKEQPEDADDDAADIALDNVMITTALTDVSKTSPPIEHWKFKSFGCDMQFTNPKT